MRTLIEKLGEDNDNIESLYIDIDEFPELGENEDINELPTILLRKNGKYLDKIIGMNESDLIKAVEKHQKRRRNFMSCGYNMLCIFMNI
ncbi:hypothetical protein PFNF54_05616 [Plasmodium falciparum NF54]|uniref:Thioredoxin domain-containing protein n=1 Tax=Plasmodium falciparum (isolate NF54) TaxID=5843 RepID=W7K8B2_PLAFO|nr:hypothetical protein PFNF54_05616 [Plasmodium falciparum NF54]